MTIDGYAEAPVGKANGMHHLLGPATVEPIAPGGLPTASPHGPEAAPLDESGREHTA